MNQDVGMGCPIQVLKAVIADFEALTHLYRDQELLLPLLTEHCFVQPEA
jgi:hypothetical protein